MALRLYRSGTVRRVLVSRGIEESGYRDKAAVMATYLRREGLPSKAILEEDAGSDTMETARHAAALERPGTGLIVVSQWFHLPRAILLREAVALPFYAIKPLNSTR